MLGNALKHNDRLWVKYMWSEDNRFMTCLCCTHVLLPHWFSLSLGTVNSSLQAVFLNAGQENPQQWPFRLCPVLLVISFCDFSLLPGKASDCQRTQNSRWCEFHLSILVLLRRLLLISEAAWGPELSFLKALIQWSCCGETGSRWHFSSTTLIFQ